MKRLNGKFTGRLRWDDESFEADELILELSHGRTITIRRDSIDGADGITLAADIQRAEKTANGRFVIRAPNFGVVHLNIEQGK